MFSSDAGVDVPVQRKSERQEAIGHFNEQSMKDIASLIASTKSTSCNAIIDSLPDVLFKCRQLINMFYLDDNICRFAATCTR